MDKKVISTIVVAIVLSGMILGFFGYTTYIIYRNNNVQKDIVGYINSQIQQVQKAQQSPAPVTEAPKLR